MIYLLVNDEKTIGRPSHLTGSNLVFQFSVPGINCNALQWLKHIHVCPNLFHSWKWWQRRTTVMISLNTRMELKRMQKYWNFPFDAIKSHELQIREYSPSFRSSCLWSTTDRNIVNIPANVLSLICLLLPICFIYDQNYLAELMTLIMGTDRRQAASTYQLIVS